MRFKPSVITLLASFILCAVSAQLAAQETLRIHSPGDTTLHGNPNCRYWLRLDPKVKETWLKAILSPINMGYMYREKPAKDHYQALPSLSSAINFVDNYCTEHVTEPAMIGALRYFEKLTSQP
jgi:hypothetical protein